MAHKHSPFTDIGTRRGTVVAVEFQQGLWCYVRGYLLSHGFLPFFSTAPLTSDQLPSLRAERHFDLWCYDTDVTPMQLTGWFPFETPDEMHGEAFYTPPNAIDRFFRIHEAVAGMILTRKTSDSNEVLLLRCQRRYQPREFHIILADKFDVWPTISA